MRRRPPLRCTTATCAGSTRLEAGAMIAAVGGKYKRSKEAEDNLRLRHLLRAAAEHQGHGVA
jgi:hypothetical protein